MKKIALTLIGAFIAMPSCVAHRSLVYAMGPGKSLSDAAAWCAALNREVTRLGYQVTMPCTDGRIASSNAPIKSLQIVTRPKAYDQPVLLNFWAPNGGPARVEIREENYNAIAPGARSAVLDEVLVAGEEILENLGEASPDYAAESLALATRSQSPAPSTSFAPETSVARESPRSSQGTTTAGGDVAPMPRRPTAQSTPPTASDKAQIKAIIMTFAPAIEACDNNETCLRQELKRLNEACVTSGNPLCSAMAEEISKASRKRGTSAQDRTKPATSSSPATASAPPPSSECNIKSIRPLPLSLPVSSKVQIFFQGFAGEGISDIEKENLESLFEAYLEIPAGVRLTKLSDVEASLDMERKKEVLGCDDATCISQIAGAFGAQYVITGTIGKLGGGFLLSARVIEASTAEPVGKATVQYRSRQCIAGAAEAAGKAIVRTKR